MCLLVTIDIAYLLRVSVPKILNQNRLLRCHISFGWIKQVLLS
jgi:hypothetical protein